MRLAVFLLIGCCFVAQAPCQEKKLDTRHGIDVDPQNFPQKTPKDALGSVLKAIQMKKIDYLVAQLSDPVFVDKRVKEEHNGKFEDMVKDVTARLLDDPDKVKLLGRYLKDGKWEEADNAASVELKDTRDKVFFKKVEERWFLENRKKGAKEK